MNLNTRKNRLSKIYSFITIGLFCVIGLNIFNRILSSPFDFDEGVMLGFAKNLLLTGKYSTHEALFDPIITIGPTVSYPVALSLIFKNIFIPRVVIFLYSLILLFVVYFGYLKNQSIRILFLCLICLTPYYYYFSSHVLGEIPALSLSLLGLLCLSQKRYLFSGLFLILAIMTKNIFLLSLIPGAYLLFTQKKFLTIKKIILFITPFFLLTAFWEFYKLQVFHFSFNDYFDNLYQMIRYNKNLSRIHLEFFSQRLSMLSGTFGLNGIVFLISMLSITIYSFIKNNNILIKSLAIYIFVYLVYFFILGPTVWYRYFFPAIVFFIVTLSSTVVNIRFSRYSLIPIIIVLIIESQLINENSKYIIQQNLLPIFDQTGNKIFTKSPLLAEQLETAKYISTKIINNNISGVVWYNAPEISYLSEKQIYRTPENPENAFLISHPFGRLLVPEVDARISKYPNKKIVFETTFYKIYKKND